MSKAKQKKSTKRNHKPKQSTPAKTKPVVKVKSQPKAAVKAAPQNPPQPKAAPRKSTTERNFIILFVVVFIASVIGLIILDKRSHNVNQPADSSTSSAADSTQLEVSGDDGQGAQNQLPASGSLQGSGNVQSTAGSTQGAARQLQ